MKKTILIITILALLFSSCHTQNNENDLELEQDIPSIQSSSTEESKQSKVSSEIEASNTESEISEIPSDETPISQNAASSSVASSENIPLPQKTNEVISNEYSAELKRKVRAHLVQADVYYKSEKIIELYSLDATKKIYVPVSAELDLQDIAYYLDSYDGSYDSNSDYGFLIITETGKYDVRPVGDSEQAKNIIELSKKCSENDIGYIQWLVYMSIANISSINYTGPTGRVLKDETYRVTFNSQQPSVIEQIGLYLKNIQGVSLSETIDSFVNPSMSLSDAYLEVEFKTGVKYTMIISRNGMTVYSSDLGYTLIYNCNEADILDFFDFVITLEQSVIEAVR